MYRDANQLPPKHNTGNFRNTYPSPKVPSGMEDLESMTKEELIHELVMARINEARLKKGYMVKGDGPNKEFILLGSKNTR
jgi:transposase